MRRKKAMNDSTRAPTAFRRGWRDDCCASAISVMSSGPGGAMSMLTREADLSGLVVELTTSISLGGDGVKWNGAASTPPCRKTRNMNREAVRRGSSLACGAGMVKPLPCWVLNTANGRVEPSPI